MDFLIGGDLGQSNDPSVSLVIARQPLSDAATSAGEGPAEDRFRFTILHVMVYPLRTPYPAVVQEFALLATHNTIRHRVNIVLDRSGVGRGIVDLFRDHGEMASITWGVSITAHSNPSRDKTSPMDWSVPKKDLVGATQLALQRQRIIHHPYCPGIGTLLQELHSFRHTTVGGVRHTFEGKGKSHDDTVTALSVALWMSHLIPYEGADHSTGVNQDRPSVLLPGHMPRHGAIPSWRDGQHAHLPYLIDPRSGHLRR